VDDLPRTPEGLDATQRDVLRAVVGAPLAWVRQDDLDPDALDRLLAPPTDYLQRWVPTGTAEVLVTLTPWGARQLGVAVGEHGPDERPVWITALPEDPRLWPRTPIHLPAYPRECPLPRPELLEDPRSGPELLLDGETGAPVVLFGRPIPIDRRLHVRRGYPAKRGARKATGRRHLRRDNGKLSL
jgi:hypothetical protein